MLNHLRLLPELLEITRSAEKQRDRRAQVNSDKTAIEICCTYFFFLIMVNMLHQMQNIQLESVNK